MTKLPSTAKTHYLGHRKRLKQKYLKSSMEGWHDYEILEFALSYAIARKDTKLISKKLLENFKTLSGVFNADIRDLEKVKGISTHSALYLRFLRDISRLYFKSNVEKKEIISSPQNVLNHLKLMLRDSKDEKFYALFMDTGNHLIAIEQLHEGTVNKSIIYPRKIAERALYNGSSGVIIVHNHPAGTLKPSEDDIRSTQAVKNALDAVETSLLDHIIIGGNGYYSWKENELL